MATADLNRPAGHPLSSHQMAQPAGPAQLLEGEAGVSLVAARHAVVVYLAEPSQRYRC